MRTNYAIYAQTLPAGQFPASRKTLLQLVSLWHDRARQRRQLAGLDDRALHDIGIDRASAKFEAAKPFWRK